VKAQRINTCSQCKFFKEETMSCGTVMSLKGLVTGTHGGLVDPSEVAEDNVNNVKYYKSGVNKIHGLIPIQLCPEALTLHPTLRG
jgi:hypothetical protein